MTASRHGALTLAGYPDIRIRLVCHKCGRAGRYRRETLLTRFGPDAALPDVLADLADCPRRGRYSDPCQAVYADLVAG